MEDVESESVHRSTEPLIHLLESVDERSVLDFHVHIQCERTDVLNILSLRTEVRLGHSTIVLCCCRLLCIGWLTSVWGR